MSSHPNFKLYLYIYGFETLSSTLSYVKEKMKKVLIHNIDDENTKYIIASKGTQLCIWTQTFNLIKVFNQSIYGTYEWVDSR